MSNRVQIWVEILRTSIWPIPAAMLVLAVFLRETTSVIDWMVNDQDALSIWWLHSGTGDDARNLLSTLVTSIITMASVMFSITMVVLSLAANQFGSRLIRTYMADIRTQLSLGIFVMTVVYCVLVLRTVSKDMPATEVPHVSVTFGLFLALVCVLTLLFFLHVIARTMVADEVIRRVAMELQQVIEKLSSLEGSTPEERRESKPVPHGEKPGVILTSRAEGYVQSVEYDDIAEIASRRGLRLELHCKAGAFMCKEGWLAEVYPSEALTSDVREELLEQFDIGAMRTPNQDLEFPIRHLVDIALRALSPGINDPNTATVVIDRLRGALSLLMGKRMTSTLRTDDAGTVRVIGLDTGYADIFDEAFNKIRQAGASQPSVVIHLLGAIERIAEHVRLPEQQSALLHHAALIADAGLANTQAPSDRSDIEKKRDGAEKKLRRALEVQSTLALRRQLALPQKTPHELAAGSVYQEVRQAKIGTSGAFRSP